MRVLPIELLLEIEKFIRSKNETYAMYSMASNYTEIKFNKLNISYICTSLKLLKWYSKYFQLNENVFTYTALKGVLKNMKWLKKNNCPMNSGTFAKAAESGVLMNMKWLKKNNCPWNNYTFQCSSRAGILKNMKWLRRNNCPWDTNK